MPPWSSPAGKVYGVCVCVTNSLLSYFLEKCKNSPLKNFQSPLAIPTFPGMGVEEVEGDL